MKLNFEVIKQVGNGKYPDLLHFANTQAQSFYIKDGRLFGSTTEDIIQGEWDDVVFETEMDISPDANMDNFELKIMPGWGGIGSYRSGNSHRMLIYEFGADDYRNYVKHRDYIEIRDANGIMVAYLSAHSDGVKDPYIDTRLNGESTLEFMMPPTSEKMKYILPECQILAGGKVYSLMKDKAIDYVRDEKNRLWAKFTAVERWNELDNSYVEPSISNDPTASPPADLAVLILGGGNDLTGGRYPVGTAGHALYAVLQGSGWNLGVCDIDGIYDLELEKESRLTLIKRIQEVWGGYLVIDSVNKVINLRNPNTWQPYRGYQVRYAKNLKHITRTQSNKIVTKLYAFGHDDLDIALVNGGVKYVTDFSYTNREYVGIYKNQDIYNQEELKAKAKMELSLICRPRYLYAVKMLDLRVLPEYRHEDFFLGEMIDVVDPDIAPNSPRPRIIRHKYNLFKPWECELDIGDPEERLVEKLKAAFNNTDFIESKFNGEGNFSGHSLEDLTVQGEKINNLAIQSRHITSLAIQSEHIEYLAINNSHIENLTITGGKIANATIDNAKIIDLKVDKLTAGTIDVEVELKAAKITSLSTITGVVIRTAESPLRRIELTSDGLTSYSSGIVKHGFSLDSWGALNLYNGGYMVGSMLYDTSGTGSSTEAKNRMFVVTYGGYALKLQSSGDMSLDAPTIYFKGNVDFPNGSRGHVYVGGQSLEAYIEDLAYWVARDVVRDYL